MEDFSKYQDEFGQLMFLKTYTQIVFGFPTPETVSDQAITANLEAAAKILTDAFPWLSGHVIREGAAPGKTGLAKIVPYAPGTRSTPVVAKDCRKLCPSLQAIIDAGAPMSMLDGEILSSREGIPCSYDESIEPAPVLLIQANFIQGGVLVTFAGQHNIVDMNGLAQMIRLFAKACRGESFTQLELEQGNRDRKTVIRLLGPDEPKTDLAPFRVQGDHPQPDAPSKWVYFHFPGPNLAELKRVASPPGSWVSTDDALSALVCQRITAARFKRLGTGEPGATATFCRAINSRRYIETPVPPEYMGHMVYCIDRTLPLNEAAGAMDISVLAGKFRDDLKNLQPVAIHSFVTGLAETEDKGSLVYGATLDSTKYDVMFSSWAGQGLYQQSFGKLGKPQIAKRHRFKPMEGLIYYMPKTDAGDIDVAVCLREEDIERLREDEILAKYGKYVG
ncbi:transferase family domain-containing protein [Trichoderma austrokoningii]